MPAPVSASAGVMRAAACLGGAAVACACACAFHLACTEPTLGAEGAATSTCAPLDEPGATVTAEALTSDGHYVVVVSRTSALRVFYGVAAHMVEGAVTAVRKSCALEVDFDVSGRSEVATFSPGPPACAVASTLKSGNAGDAIVQVPLTVLIPAEASDAGDAGDASDSGGSTPLSALTFFCR